MTISIIAAIAKNNVIGYKNKIPWNLPADMQWFKNCTLNKTIIMGRLTWDSLVKKPLPNRLNIILSKKNKKYNSKIKEILWLSSIKEIIKISEQKEIMVIGGSNIYNQLIKYSHRMYLTHINIQPYGDSYFPYYKKKEWDVIFRKLHKPNKNNLYNYYFEILQKK